jgi:HK97 family phage portal protein
VHADVNAAPARKSGPLVALELSRRSSFTAQSYSSLSRQGYRRNPIVYRCVRLIAESAASVPLIFEGDAAPRARALLTSASPHCPQGEARQSFFGQLQIAGSAYLEATLVDDQPVAIRNVRPDSVEVAKNARGQAMGWTVQEGEGRARLLRVDPVTHRSPMLAMHLFDPLEPDTGHGPLEACAQSVDIHNEGARWTKSLLDNSARPSGALIYKGPSGGERLTDNQFERLKDELETQHSGARQAGRPLLLEGGLDWKSMSMSPADMDFIQARREAAREIAFAFGVPPMLLGIPGDNTYSNYREANHAFWRDTVLPLVTRFACAAQGWLGAWMDDELNIRPDADSIVALNSERDALWKRVGEAEFLTDSERRAILGLEVRDE